MKKEDIISKELLSDVLGIGFIKTIELLGNTVYILSNDEAESMSINIHELAHKCKEWARSNLFSYMNIGTISETRAVLDLRTKLNFGIWRGYSCSIVTLDERHSVLHTTKCYETEAEAIFKACQWIYDNQL